MMLAAAAVLTAAKRPTHADDLVKAIFLITEKDSFQRAKNALVGELVRGVQRKFFIRTGKNEYALNEKCRMIGVDAVLRAMARVGGVERVTDLK